MILIPASTAYQLTHSLKTLTLYSMAIGVATAVGGVIISAVCDLPSGPAIVLLATVVFFCAVFLSPKRMNRASPAHSH
jgi:ABC-type Mn2+/Zn2+ transport system permease subunit